MEWLAGLIGLGVGLLLGFLVGVFLMILMLARSGYTMDEGKILPIKSIDPVLVVNFPAGMDEDKAERILTEALAKSRTTVNVGSGGMSSEELEKAVERIIGKMSMEMPRRY